MEKIKTGFPSVAECINAVANYNKKYSIVANNLANDTFAAKHKENKKKLKKAEEDAARHQYAVTEVKKAANSDRLFSEEERTGILGGIGALYMCSYLIDREMEGSFGELLKQSTPGARELYKFIIEGIRLQNEMLLAFTDRFSLNAAEFGAEEYGLEINTAKLVTDTDVLAIDNIVKTFSRRFRQQIESQEERVAEIMREREEAEREAAQAEKLNEKQRIKDERKRLKAERFELKKKEEEFKKALEEEAAKLEEKPKPKRGRPRKKKENEEL